MIIRSAVIYVMEVLSDIYVFNRVLNTDVVWMSRNVHGIEFQTLGAVRENLYAPFFVLHCGPWSSFRSDDCSDLVGGYEMILNAR